MPLTEEVVEQPVDPGFLLDRWRNLHTHLNLRHVHFRRFCRRRRRSRLRGVMMTSE